LLVVIAIIAILAAILFPVFAKAREKARQSSCQSNTKQMGIAVIGYINDYDGMYPQYIVRVCGAGGGFGASPLHQSWKMSILPYAKSTQIFQCPSYSPPAPLFDGGAAANSDVGQNSGYAVNLIHWGSGSIATCASPIYNGVSVAESDIVNVAATVVLADYDSVSNGTYIGYNLMTHDFVRNITNAPDKGALRHNGGCNYLFCDGHVKWLTPTGVRCKGDSDCMWNIKCQ
jgi:prepilin-type processing-associated H-X9-DG protein